MAVPRAVSAGMSKVPWARSARLSNRGVASVSTGTITAATNGQDIALTLIPVRANGVSTVRTGRQWHEWR